MDKDLQTLLSMAAVGVLAGLSNLLASAENLTWRLVVGRSVSSGILAVAAGSVLIWIPELPSLALLGLSAALASLGTSALERLIHKHLTAGKKS